MLIERVMVTRDATPASRVAVAAGITKYRVHELTGIGRSTIGASSPPAWPGRRPGCLCPSPR